MDPATRELRATFTSEVITVYQAYSSVIADAALKAGTLVQPFSFSRATWIKPSFFWMMYRSDWGRRSGQERILAIDITRNGFEWALAHSCLSTYEPGLYLSPEAWRQEISQAYVVIQWDPDRDARLQKLPRRTIQVGLRGQAVPLYAQQWIVRVADLTPLAKQIFAAVKKGDLAAAYSLVPSESPYPLGPDLARKIGLYPPAVIEKAE